MIGKIPIIDGDRQDGLVSVSQKVTNGSYALLLA